MKRLRYIPSITYTSYSHLNNHILAQIHACTSHIHGRINTPYSYWRKALSVQSWKKSYIKQFFLQKFALIYRSLSLSFYLASLWFVGPRSTDGKYLWENKLSLTLVLTTLLWKPTSSFHAAATNNHPGS